MQAMQADEGRPAMQGNRQASFIQKDKTEMHSAASNVQDACSPVLPVGAFAPAGSAAASLSWSAAVFHH